MEPVRELYRPPQIENTCQIIIGYLLDLIKVFVNLIVEFCEQKCHPYISVISVHKILGQNFLLRASPGGPKSY